jgi:hypothetical protein
MNEGIQMRKRTSCYIHAILLLCGCGSVKVADSDAAVDDKVPIPDATLDAATSRPANIIFVTSKNYPGKTDGIAGADARCQDAATAGGLPGNFVAFLSSTLGTGVSRLASSNSRGWVRVDGTAVADFPSDFESKLTLNPANYSEFGIQVTGDVWTGGLATDATCTEWTSATAGQGTAGDVSSQREWFNFTTNKPCANSRRLICTEIGKKHSVTQPAIALKRLFVSKQPWKPAGLASADALCNSEAVAAGLSGAYLALLNVTGQKAAARMSNAGSDQYQRVDGAMIGGLALAPSTFLTVRASGMFDSSDLRVWTGGDPSMAAVNTCSDWASSLAAAKSTIGRPYVANTSAYNFAESTCDKANSIYCVEQ